MSGQEPVGALRFDARSGAGSGECAGPFLRVDELRCDRRVERSAGHARKTPGSSSRGCSPPRSRVAAVALLVRPTASTTADLGSRLSASRSHRQRTSILVGASATHPLPCRPTGAIWCSLASGPTEGVGSGSTRSTRSCRGHFPEPRARLARSGHPMVSTSGSLPSNRLKRVSISGGDVATICDARYGGGATWNRDGVILFAPAIDSALFRVPATGGTPTPVTDAGCCP